MPTPTPTLTPPANAYVAKQPSLPAQEEETPEDDKELALNLYLTEALLIFMGKQFLFLDPTKKSGWNLGICDNQFLTVNEDASIVMVDPQKHQTNSCQAIATGGCKDICLASNLVLSLNF